MLNAVGLVPRIMRKQYIQGADKMLYSSQKFCAMVSLLALNKYISYFHLSRMGGGDNLNLMFFVSLE